MELVRLFVINGIWVFMTVFAFGVNTVVFPTNSLSVSGEFPFERQEEYRLVLSPRVRTESDDKRIGRSEWDSHRHEQIERFVVELNKFGQRGYRLLSIADGWSPVAVVKLEKGEFEYAWFETKSHRAFSKLDFGERLSSFSDRGFRIVHQIRTMHLCEPVIDYEGLIVGEECEFVDLFVLERINGNDAPTHQFYKSIPSNRWPGSKTSVEIAEVIADGKKNGLSPVLLFSKFEVLLDRTDGDQTASADHIEKHVIRSDGKGKLKKRVNELARLGYRIDLVSNGIALMHRNRDDVEPRSYVWLDTSRRNMMLRRRGLNFHRELARIGQAGAIFKFVYPNGLGDHSTLIFEKITRSSQTHVEYATIDIGITEAAKTAAVAKLASLTKDGFLVRALFAGENTNVLLERMK